MKRKILALILMGCLAMTACTSGEDAEQTQAETDEAGADEAETDAAETDEAETEEIDTSAVDELTDVAGIPVVEDTVEDAGMDAFVTLGEYKGLALEKNLYTVTEDDIEAEIALQLESTPVTGEDVEVAMGDTVIMDFAGTVDGVAFDGGTAENYELVIGSGSFIEGFEEQMVGLKLEEVGEVHVTFPEDYDEESLQGKDAVFAVTVHEIYRSDRELTEEWILENTEYTNEEDYRAAVKTYLEDSDAQTAESELSDSAWSAVFETAAFTQYPREMLRESYLQQVQSYQSYASSYGMEYEEFMTAIGMTDDLIIEDAVGSLQNTLVVEYICEKEEVGEGSQEYEDVLANLLELNGYASLEDALAYDIPEWYIDFSVKYTCAMDVVIDNAVITEVAAE